jgi:crotonobetainyl-CoA:carnitine CoA-transferase CaiB-like acyl-CoA transferase
MSRPLDGIRILDVGTLTPGKYCTYLLADLGADVIRIERPVSTVRPVDDEDLILNQGKRSVTLNLRSDTGKDLFLKLAADADVIVEGNRPGVAERNGIGFAAVEQQNQSIVYCALSGYGASGPMSQAPGYDLIFLGVSGLLRGLSGNADLPLNPHVYLADGISGLSAAYAITAALLNRQRSGQGRFIDLAMLDSVFSLLAVSHGTRKLSAGVAAGEVRTEQPPSPLYDIYTTAENTYLVLGAVREASRQALFEHLGRPELAGSSGSDETRAFLRKVFLKKSAETWVRELAPLDIEVGRVNHPDEAFDNPQLRARDMIGEALHPDVGEFEFIRPGLNLNVPERREPPSRSPRIGEHTGEVLHSLGVTASDLPALRGDGDI